MERSRMNLPKGLDTLCFDKDEFMKVRAWALLPGAGRGWPALLGPPGPLLGLLLRASWAVPAPDGSSAGTSLHFTEDFDVDHVVSDCRKRVQLEELRGDLELYYKLLKQPWLSSSTRIMQILSTFPQTWLAWTKPSMNFLCLWDSYEKF
ncbi:uncharacterized protein LOC131810247 isoform X2 [Mustela lutreola]|nr:uncharacterized protein LOC131810247 isoform X2 [Mustela lutreola]